MAKLTPAERTSLAKKAAAERWARYQGGEVYTPEAIGDLPIVGHTIPCAVIVVEGEIIRLVSERDLVKSLGGKRGGSHWLRAREDADAANLPPILSAANLREFISEDLMQGLNSRYMFKNPGRGGSAAHGLRGELYPMICDVFLKARDARKLLPSQENIAISADILIRALACLLIVFWSRPTLLFWHPFRSAAPPTNPRSSRIQSTSSRGCAASRPPNSRRTPLPTSGRCSPRQSLVRSAFEEVSTGPGKRILNIWQKGANDGG